MHLDQVAVQDQSFHAFVNPLTGVDPLLSEPDVTCVTVAFICEHSRESTRFHPVLQLCWSLDGRSLVDMELDKLVMGWISDGKF